MTRPAEGKKLLMLGASMQQVPAIRRAKELGCYVITCDYLPENPGHVLADESYDVSTTDMEGVLKLARKLQVDGIVAYASDPAASTAAYVAERLGLPGNPYESVRILTEKDRFRSFLVENGFNSPVARGFSQGEKVDISGMTLPVMVKPVDSSGSKGVVKVEDPTQLALAVEEAFSYSRNGRIIVEEFIRKMGYQASGDGFTVDGRLVFTSYGNELYSADGVRDYVALGEFWPSLLTDAQKEALDGEIQGIVSALGMRTGAYNIEAIFDGDGRPYIIELGPRNGGSYIPQLIELATGVDLIEYTVLGALGLDCSALDMAPTCGVYSNYMIMSRNSGTFIGLRFDDAFERDNLIAVYCTAKEGDEVEAYRNTTHSLGTVLFKAASIEEMERITSNMKAYCEVIVA